MNIQEATHLTLYTGNNGKRQCTGNCPGCLLTEKGEKLTKFYQGNITQIYEALEMLPKLEEVHILGNPDFSVDTDFCNQAAKVFISKGKKVMFSTSGLGGIKKLEALFEGLDPKYVKYIGFSVDSVNQDTSDLLKGRKNSLKEIGQQIEYCQKLGINVRIQPTLWEVNQNDYREIIDFFYSKYGVKWYTFHTGSFVGVPDNSSDICKHIKPDVWCDIVKDLQEIGTRENLVVRVPKTFVTEEEYEQYCKEYIPYCLINRRKYCTLWLDTAIRGAVCTLLGETGIKRQSKGCPVIPQLMGKELYAEFTGTNEWISSSGRKYFATCCFYRCL